MKSFQNQSDKLKVILAFKKYAKLGLSNKKLSPFDAYDRIRGVCKSKSDALDLLAVYDTLRLLHISGKDDVISSIYAIYFDLLGRRPKKNEITSRVIRHAYDTHRDERTVYRQLEYARKLYIALRFNK